MRTKWSTDRGRRVKCAPNGALTEEEGGQSTHQGPQVCQLIIVTCYLLIREGALPYFALSSK